jgi:hypothetical protein
MLLGQERDHIKRIRSVYDSLRGGEAWAELWKPQKAEDKDLQEFLMDQIALLGRKIHAMTGDLQALEIGIVNEQQSIDF